MSESTHTETESVAEAEDSPDFIRDVVTGRLKGRVIDPETGDEYPAVFKDPTDDDLARLEDLELQAAEQLEDAPDDTTDPVDPDADWARAIVEDFLIEIEADGVTYSGDDLGTAGDYPMGWKQSISMGFLKAVGADNAALRDAEQFFEDRLPGNR